MGPKTIGGPNEHHDWVLMGGAWGKALLWMMIIKRKGNLGFLYSYHTAFNNKKENLKAAKQKQVKQFRTKKKKKVNQHRKPQKFLLSLF